VIDDAVLKLASAIRYVSKDYETIVGGWVETDNFLLETLEAFLSCAYAIIGSNKLLFEDWNHDSHEI
jgi:hypothetical protein